MKFQSKYVYNRLAYKGKRCTRHAAYTPTKKQTKITKGMSTPGFSEELSTAIMLQRSDPEFIKAISCKRDSYYIFLGTTI